MESKHQIYDSFVNAYTLNILETLSKRLGNEEVALHVTILAFEKLWYHIENNNPIPDDIEYWLLVESDKLMR